MLQDLFQITLHKSLTRPYHCINIVSSAHQNLGRIPNVCLYVHCIIIRLHIQHHQGHMQKKFTIPIILL